MDMINLNLDLQKFIKNVLIVGLGGIGVSVAEKLNSFGAIVSSAETGLNHVILLLKIIMIFMN